MLTIKDLHASVNDTPIFHGIDLEVKAGEVHDITSRQRPKYDLLMNPHCSTDC